MITTRTRFVEAVQAIWKTHGHAAVNPYAEGADLHADWQLEFDKAARATGAVLEAA